MSASSALLPKASSIPRKRLRLCASTKSRTKPPLREMTYTLINAGKAIRQSTGLPYRLDHFFLPGITDAALKDETEFASVFFCLFCLGLRISRLPFLLAIFTPVEISGRPRTLTGSLRKADARRVNGKMRRFPGPACACAKAGQGYWPMSRRSL